jgi:hypothetical protein
MRLSDHSDETVLEWLLDGDPAIRWQVMRRKQDGRWPLQKRIPGTLLVEFEKPGGDSRWNTLRALRVLRRRDA